MTTPRGLIAIPGVVLATVVFGALQILASLVDATGRISDACARAWARVIALACGMRVAAGGAENVPAGRTCVIVCNHQSHLDTVALYLTCPVPMRMLAKASLFRIPFLGWSMARMGHVPIARERADAAALLRLRAGVDRLVRRGQSVVVFAEGARGEGDALQPFKKGAFHLARTFALPIVPVAIAGTGAILPARTLRFHGGAARVTYLPPIEPLAGDGADREVEDLLAETRARIDEALG